MKKGIDLSKYNGIVDFDLLKTAVDFVWIKASSGTGLIDNLFSRNRAEAERVGLTCGFYAYAYPEYNEPEAEADWFASVIGDRGVHALALDYESSWQGDVVSWCKRFLDKLSSHYNGYRPYIYLNLNTIKQHDWSSVADNGNLLWLAHWDYNPLSPAPTDLPWKHVDLRQYSNHISVPGCPTPVDGDVFYDEADLTEAPTEHFVESLGIEFAGDPSFTVLRKVPSDGYEEVETRGSFGSHFDKGWIGRIIGEQGDWYLVSIGGGVQQGWVKKTYVTIPGYFSPVLASAPSTFKVKNTSKFNVRIRTAPSLLHSQVTGKLSPGGTVDCIETVRGDRISGNSTWYRTTDNQYLSGAYVIKL